MADGDSLILGTSNNAQAQTNLSVGLGDESGSYGLQVQALASPPEALIASYR